MSLHESVTPWPDRILASTHHAYRTWYCVNTYMYVYIYICIYIFTHMYNYVDNILHDMICIYIYICMSAAP